MSHSSSAEGRVSHYQYYDTKLRGGTCASERARRSVRVGACESLRPCQKECDSQQKSRNSNVADECFAVQTEGQVRNITGEVLSLETGERQAGRDEREQSVYYICVHNVLVQRPYNDDARHPPL